MYVIFANFFQFQTGSVPDVSLLNRSLPGVPPNGPPPLPPAPPPLPGTPQHHSQHRDSLQAGQPPPLVHRNSNPNINPQVMSGHEIYDNAGSRSLGDYGMTQMHHEQHAFSNMVTSPPQSSSGYSGSSNRMNVSSNGSHYSMGSAPGFPPPPPNLAPPPPPTSDYEDDSNRFVLISE